MLVICALSEEEYIFFILCNFDANSIAEEMKRTESEGRQTSEETTAVVSLEMMRVLAAKMRGR